MTTARDKVVLTCRTADGRTWRVESRPRQPAPDMDGRWRRIWVMVSDEAGDREHEVPLKLCFGSWLRYAVLGTWPPERARGLRADGNCVVVAYRDEWIPFEKPVLPFGYDRESEWEARFDPARRTWHLTRIRHLDYEGKDRP